MSAYNPNAKTPAEHLENCQFQLDNVKGWLLAVADHPDESGPLIAADMKAECLVEAAALLKASLEAERRKLKTAREDSRPTTELSGGEYQQPLTAEPGPVAPGTAALSSVAITTEVGA